MAKSEKAFHLDLSNTEIAYDQKSDKELKEMARLFRVMNNPNFVGVGSFLGLTAMKLKLPLTNTIIKKTIFPQFVGGETLLDCQKTIDYLCANKVLTILDYGAESKSADEDLDNVRDETIRALKFAASNGSVPSVSTKITGLAQNKLLVKLNYGEELDNNDKHEYKKLYNRLDAICKVAHDHDAAILIDAEESWMQIAIDNLTDEMMEKYNSTRVAVWNTYQLYRHDKLDHLKLAFDVGRERGFKVGAKLVRGAYMDKEREFAKENNLEDPIQPDKASSDRDYNLALTFCVENYENIGVICASHNAESTMHLAKMIDDHGLDKRHPHLNFCQLFGMSDNISFNLANAGYNIAKYVPYGPVREVIPYLIRRAKENTAVTGEMSRELSYVLEEIKRRGM